MFQPTPTTWVQLLIIIIINYRHQPELLPSLILHVLIFLIGVTGHVCLLYYLHNRHIRWDNIPNPIIFLFLIGVTGHVCLLDYLHNRHIRWEDNNHYNRGDVMLFIVIKYLMHTFQSLFLGACIRHLFPYDYLISFFTQPSCRCWE